MVILPVLATDTLSRFLAAIGTAALFLFVSTAGQANPAVWKFEWPRTDFDQTSIDYSDIRSGGPPKDGIPSIDDPKFASIEQVRDDIEPSEPVITVEVNGQAKAYPLSILIWHEIVNDELGGVPISVTYCPLCNSAVVFDRRLGDRVLDFGTTGKLRFSDLVMYDRQTESWWQQFVGEAIVGELTGQLLTMLPVRVEAFERFVERFPDGQVQVVPSNFRRAYGQNPYVGYDSSRSPFLYDGPNPDGIAPLAYVVAVAGEAWSLDLLQQERRIEKGDLVLTWEPGAASALDRRRISEGRDLGNVVVQRRKGSALADEVHDLTFAFSFHAFHPDGVIHLP